MVNKLSTSAILCAPCGKSRGESVFAPRRNQRNAEEGEGRDEEQLRTMINLCDKQQAYALGDLRPSSTRTTPAAMTSPAAIGSANSLCFTVTSMCTVAIRIMGLRLYQVKPWNAKAMTPSTISTIPTAIFQFISHALCFKTVTGRVKTGQLFYFLYTLPAGFRQVCFFLVFLNRLFFRPILRAYVRRRTSRNRRSIPLLVRIILRCSGGKA